MRALVLSLPLLVAALNGAAPSAEAAGGFGVSPVELDLTDPPVLRGSALEGVFRVQNREAVDLDITVQPSGAIAPWLKAQPATLTVPSGQSRDVRVAVAVPQDAANGQYTAQLRMRAAPSGSVQGSGSSLAMELVPLVKVAVGGAQVVKLAFDAVQAQAPEEGKPLVLVATVTNAGNVRTVPALDVEVRDAAGAVALKERVEGAALAPRASGAIPFTTTAALPSSGEHAATVRLLAGSQPFGERTVGFEAAPAGSSPQQAQGAFAVLGFDAAPQKDRPLKVHAVFKNTGSQPVQAARLVAEVFRDGQRVAALRSDPVAVAPGQEQVLEVFFTPKHASAYQVQAHVLYDGAKSPARDAVVQVAGAGGEAAKSTPGVALPAMLLAAALGALALGARRRP